MTAALVDGIARLIAAQVAGVDYATDRALDPALTPLTIGAGPSSDGPAVVLNTYPGGPPPDTRNGWEYPRLQVRVRSDNPYGALDLDRDVFEALQPVAGRYPAPLFGWELQDCYALQSEAQPLGVDANGRHEYVRNYQLSVAPTS